jgi:hypothetical protein
LEVAACALSALKPAEEILDKFRADEAAIIALFITLALSAALLAPIALLLGRLAAGGGQALNGSRRPAG